MFFVAYEKINEEKAIVTQFANIDYVQPPDMTGFTVEEIPNSPQPPVGKNVQTFVNPNTKEFFYEYVDRPKTPEEELEDLKRQQALMQTAIDDLIFGGML